MADNQQIWDWLKQKGQNSQNAMGMSNTALPNNPINKLNQTYNSLNRATQPLMNQVSQLQGTQNQSRLMAFNDPAQDLKNQIQLVQQQQNNAPIFRLQWTQQPIQEKKFNNVANPTSTQKTTTGNGLTTKQTFRWLVDEATIKNYYQEKFLNNFQRAVYENNWLLSEERINSLIEDAWIKELNKKINTKDLLSLQSDIAPILKKSWEYVNNEDIAIAYPNLYNKTDTKSLKNYYKEQDKKFQELVKSVKKANYNVLSDDGKIFYNWLNELATIPDIVRSEYNVGKDVTDTELISSVAYYDDNWKNVVNQISQAKQNLSYQDKRQMFWSTFGGWWILGLILMNSYSNMITPLNNTALSQWIWQLNQAWQENVQPLIDERRVEDTGMFNFVDKGKNVWSNIFSMPWNALSWADRAVSNYQQLLDIDPNKPFWKQVSEKLENAVKVGWWTIDVAFNTALFPVTTAFHIAEWIPVVWEVVDETFWFIPKAVDFIMSWKALNQLWFPEDASWRVVSDWYNNELDDQWRADFQNEVFLILAKKFQWSKAQMKTEAFMGELWRATKEAINDGKVAYDLETSYRKKVNWGSVYEERHTLPEYENPEWVEWTNWNTWPKGWDITGWPVNIESRREWKLSSSDRIASIKRWVDEWIKSFKNKITDPLGEHSKALENKFLEIDKKYDEKRVLEGTKKAEDKLKESMNKELKVDEQLKDLDKKVWNSIKELKKSEPNFLSKKISWMSEWEIDKIRSNPFAVDETRRMVEALDDNPWLDINDYTVSRYENILDTVVKKIGEIENKRTQDVWPIYDLFERLQAPIDISWLKKEVRNLARDLTENMTRWELSKFNELANGILNWDIETADKLWQIRKLADTYSDWDWNRTEWKQEIRNLRKSIDNVFRSQIPEFKELDAKYIQVLDELRDVRDRLYTKKNWKWTLRENAVSTIKNLLGASNRQYLNRLEKYIPGIKQAVQGVDTLKSTYKSYTQWGYNNLTKWLAWFFLRGALRLGWMIKWWAFWYLEWMAIDTTLEWAINSLSRRAIRDMLTKMNPKAIAEFQRLLKKVEEWKELSKAEKAKLNDLEDRIVSKIDAMKKSKAEKEAWDEFKEWVEEDNSKQKLTKKDNVKNDGRTIVTGNDKTIVSDGKWNEKREWRIDEVDKRTEDNKKSWYTTEEKRILNNVDNAEKKLEAWLNKIWDKLESWQRWALVKDIQDLRNEIKIAEDKGYTVDKNTKDTLRRAEDLLWENKNSLTSTKTAVLDRTEDKTPQQKAEDIVKWPEKQLPTTKEETKNKITEKKSEEVKPETKQTQQTQTKKKVKPQLDQGAVAWVMYHVTPEQFEQFDENKWYNWIDWNTAFWTFVTDSDAFLDDFKQKSEDERWRLTGGKEWNKKTLDVDAKNVILHPYDLWSVPSLDNRQAETILLDYLDKVWRLNYDTMKDLVWLKMLDTGERNDIDYDTYNWKDSYTKEDILNMPWSIYWWILEAKFDWEDQNEFLFWDYAEEDAKKLKELWYDAVQFYEWNKDGEEVYSYALSNPNKYLKNENVSFENKATQEAPKQEKDTVSNTKNAVTRTIQRDLDASPIITMNNGKIQQVTAEDIVESNKNNITAQNTTITQPKQEKKKSNNAPASNVLQQVKDKWKDVEMYNFDDEDSEWGGRNSKRFLNFSKDLKKAFKVLADENNFELEKYNVGYYYVFVYFKNNNSDNPQYYYVNVWDTRTPGRADHILYRTAPDTTWRTNNHWSNNYSPLEKLPRAIVDKWEKVVITEDNIDEILDGGAFNPSRRDFWLVEQKNTSRINIFENIVGKIINKYADKINKTDSFTELEVDLWEPYMPLTITYFPYSKELIVAHNTRGTMQYDPAISFLVTNDGSLNIYNWINSTWTNGSRVPMKENDELLKTLAVNLEDQYLWTRTINEDTGEVETPKVKNAVTTTKVEEKPKNLITSNITPKVSDDKEITGRFRDLTLEDYRTMQKFQGLEEEYYRWDKEKVVYTMILKDVIEELRTDDIEYNEFEDWYDFDLTYPTALLERNSFIDEWNFYQRLKDWKATKQDLLDHDWIIDNWEEYDDKHPEKFKPDWNEEYVLEGLDDYFGGMFWKEPVYDPFVTQAFNVFRDLIKDKDDYAKDFNEKRALIQELVNKYWEYWKPVDNSKQNVNNKTENKTALTSNKSNNETNLSTSKPTVWWENQWEEWERRVQVSNVQSTVWNKVTGVQGSNDKQSTWWTWLIWSSEWASTNGEWLTAPGRSRGLLSVKEQRDINEESRKILKEHNFSVKRSDYTNEELNTLFQYSWNWGVAKAEDEDVYWSRFQYYTPDLASEALWRWVKKYLWSNTFKGKAIDPTTWLWDLFKYAYDEWWEVWGFEIDPVPGTIAKLKFPDWDLHIWEKEWDFQRRFLNFKWDAVYDKPRDWGFNADVILINPPFGNRITVKHDKPIKSLEDYFVKNSIQYDSKDENTIIGLLMPSRWLKAPENKAKDWLNNNTTFLDAYRLPSGVFQYTDVGTDLIILKNTKWDSKTNYFINDNFFKENPDKILWEVKERKGRYGMEEYVDWDPEIIKTIWVDEKPVEKPLDTEPTPQEKKSQTTSFVPKEVKTKVKEEVETKTPVTWWDKTALTSKWKKKATKSKGRTTVSTGDKTDVGLYIVNPDKQQELVYIDHTDPNWYVEKKYYSIDKVKRWEDPDLNFIRDTNWTPQVQTNTLYFWWDVYAKLDQLEKDYKDGYLEEKQYNKQKEWLNSVIPETVKIEDITRNPFDETIMNMDTDILNDYWRSRTIKELFERYLRDSDKVPSSFFSWLNVSRREMIRSIINWETIRAESVSKDDPDYERKKEEAQAVKQMKIEDIKEWWGALFNQFLQNELSEEMQNKIEIDFNKKYRSYVNPDFMWMPFSIDNMSNTFKWDKLVMKAVQNEWIAFLTSKSWGSLTFGVWIGKTLTWIASVEKMIQLGRSKKPVICVPIQTVEDWLKTYHDAFPLREIVYWWWLNAPDIKRLKQDLWEDPKNWIKDGQVLLITYSWLDTLQYKWDTQKEIMANLRDVMWTAIEDEIAEERWEGKKKRKKKTATQQDKENEEMQALTEQISKKRRKSKAQEQLDAELSEKYWDSVLEELLADSEDMTKEEFTKDFLEKTNESPLSEAIKKEDAERMYNARPVFVEDLWIDFLCVDEVHNFKNSFKKAKAKSWEDSKYQSIWWWKPSTQAVQMFVLTQYIAKNFQNWAWTFSLSATPFTNQPVEIYNILSLHAYNRLAEKWITNIDKFFDLFAKLKVEYLADKRKYWEVMRWFNNLPELQRLIGEYMLYHWDSPDLVRPDLRIKEVKLDPSPLQRQIQKALENEYKSLRWLEKRVRGMAILTDIQQNALSPYLTQYAIRRWIFPESREEFINNSPKLKFVLEYTKAQREFGMDDWIFTYMSRWVEFHPMLKEAIEQYTKNLKVATKVWIISWDEASKTVTIDWERVPKKILTAKEFREWIINFLIWWEQTAEWINLQDKWYSTVIVVLWRNPTEIIQVMWRIRRQWNLRDHVQVIIPLIKNWWDITKMQKFYEKQSRIDELWSFRGRGLELEWISPDEERFALVTDPELKAQIYIDIEDSKLQKEIQQLTGKMWNIKEARTAIKDNEPVAESYKQQRDEHKEKVEKLREEAKALPKDSSAYTLLQTEIDKYVTYRDRAKKEYEKTNNAIERAWKTLRWYNIETLEEVDNILKDLDDKTNKVLEEKEKLKNSANEILERFKKEQEELDKDSKTIEQYIEEIKSDWWNLIKFETIKDQKEYLDIRRELENFKKEVVNSRKVTANDKNKLTS